jgi:hypothetical protein
MKEKNMNAIRATELVDLVHSKCYEFTEGGHNGTLTKFEAAEIVDALYEEFAKDEPEVEEEQEKKYVWVVGFSTEGKDCLSVWDSKEGAIRQKKCLIGKDIYVEKLTLFSRES